MSSASSSGFSSFDSGFVEAVVAHAGIALVASDEQLRVRLWNPAAARLFGAEAGAMLGTPLAAVIPKQARVPAEEAFASALTRRESSELEFRYPDEHGRFRELAVNVSPLQDHDGAVRGVVLCARDITRRFEAEARAAEARKMAALGDMAGGVAHHFNNILGGITTTVDYALSTGDEGKLREALEKTVTATARAAQLIRGLLTFAEGDTLGDPPGEMNDLIARVESEFAAVCRRQGIELRVECPLSIPGRYASNSVLTVLRQIAQNAVDAMGQGGRLVLSVRPTPEGVSVDANDTGPGLHPEETRRIFEPFFRIEQGRLNECGHTGLGLAIAYGIVRRLGGSLTVDSQPGKGTRFQVTFNALTE